MQLGQRMTISLAGEWRFTTDAAGYGHAQGEEWFRKKPYGKATLPGTTVTNRAGLPRDTIEGSGMTPLFSYTGAAWFQRDVDIPSDWAGKRVSLVLERSKHTTVWLDDTAMGSCDNLYTPHVYELGEPAQGRHTLTIRCFNGVMRPMEHNLTEWNGVIGAIRLEAADPVRIDRAHVTPDIARGKAFITLTLRNDTGMNAHGTLLIHACASGHEPEPVETEFFVAGAEREKKLYIDYDMGRDFLLWDEFAPNLYNLKIELIGQAAGRPVRDRAETRFGMREFAVSGTQFRVNGKTVLLRGNTFSHGSMEEGHEWTTLEEWTKAFALMKEYGLNHIRFHSFTPPAAAFDAADELGLYIQPELCVWEPRTQEDPAFEPMLEPVFAREGDAVLDEYRNHPSFVMMALGNEIIGDRALLKRLVDGLRAKDPSRLYAQGSNNYWDNPSEAAGDDYWTTFRTRAGGFTVRGSLAHVNKPLGFVQTLEPGTMADYSEGIAGATMPVIAHEVGQYEMFPDLRTRSKASKAFDKAVMDSYAQTLATQGMEGLDSAFLEATGALAVACYRQDLEAAFRTRGFGGFQLLGLQDYGLGIHVGILTSFLDSKGLISPTEWRKFCNDRVLLFKTARFTLTTAEALTGTLTLANYGASGVAARPLWRIVDASGRTVRTGGLSESMVPQGTLMDLGTLELDLSALDAPAAYTLELELEGTGVDNRYTFWLYEGNVREPDAGDVLVTERLDGAAEAALRAGGKVLLMPRAFAPGRTLEGSFSANFWTYAHFYRDALKLGFPPAPHTLGLLCDPCHAMLTGFPTEKHNGWQWWSILRHSRSVILDDLPRDFAPVMRIVDHAERGHKLGLVFEGRVGKGSVLVCGARLKDCDGDPAASLLYRELLAYMRSADFKPEREIDAQWLKTLTACH